MTHCDHDYVIETSMHRLGGLRHIKKEQNIFEKISKEYGSAPSDCKNDDVMVCSQSSAVSVCNNQSALTTMTSLNPRVSSQKIYANKKKSKNGNSKSEIAPPNPLTMLIRNSTNILKLFAENGEKDVKKVVSAILKSQMDPKTESMFSSNDITPEEFIEFLKSYKLTIKPLLAPESTSTKTEKSKKKSNSTTKWRYAANKTKPSKFKWHHTNFKEKPSRPNKTSTPVPPYATPLAQAYVELAARDRATAETLQTSSHPPFNHVTRNDPCLPSATEAEDADCLSNFLSPRSDPLDDVMEIMASESFNRDLCMDNSFSLWSDDSCLMDFEVNRNRESIDWSRPIINSKNDSTCSSFHHKSTKKEQVEDVGEKTEKKVTMLNSSIYTNQQFPPSTPPPDFDMYFPDDFSKDLIDASNCIESIIGTDLFPCPGENGDGDSWFFSGPDIPDPASHKYFEECSSPHDSGIASPGSISPSTGDFSPLNEPDHPSYPPNTFFPFPSEPNFFPHNPIPSPPTPEHRFKKGNCFDVDIPPYEELMPADRSPNLSPLEPVPPQLQAPATPPTVIPEPSVKPPSPKKKKNVHLWVFIRDLLLDPKHCPSLIKWEDREAGLFRFVQSEAVAAMWGEHKQNSNMTYEKLSRAMRYYYQRLILERVDGRRLVYKFGPKSYGWQLNSKPETCAENSHSISTPPTPEETAMATSTSPSWYNDHKTEFEWPTEPVDSTADFFNHSTLMPISTLLNPAKRVTTA